MERSGTRKEELIYHPDELLRIYSLRRAMQGIPPVEAMEMVISRLKKTRSNAEFLLSLNRWTVRRVSARWFRPRPSTPHPPCAPPTIPLCNSPWPQGS